MDAFILIAPGDEGFAADLATRIAPATSIEAPLAAAGGLAFGEQLVVFAIWSASGETSGLGRQLADVARRLGDRFIVVRVDGTPLPALSGSAQVVVLGRDNDLGAMLKVARLRTRSAAAASAPVRRSFQVSSVGPGVGVGLAIYAGMFVAAGAWRSDEISQAIATDKEAPAVLALRSFQTAFDAPETAHVSVASSVPNARFVAPQRVIVTASMESATLPVFAAETSDAPTPLARIDDTVEVAAKAPSMAVPVAVPVTPSVTPPVTPLMPVPDIASAATLSLISLDGMSTFDSIQNEAF